MVSCEMYRLFHRRNHPLAFESCVKSKLLQTSSSLSPSDAVSVASSLLVFSFSTSDLATVSGLSLLQESIEGTASRFNLRLFESGLIKSSRMICSLQISHIFVIHVCNKALLSREARGKKYLDVYLSFSSAAKLRHVLEQNFHVRSEMCLF